MYAANGHGVEAALSNTLSPGDTVLVPGTGEFSTGWSDWQKFAAQQYIFESDWRHGINPSEVSVIFAGPKTQN